MKEFEAFQTMDEETRLKMLEGVEDCITPAIEEERKFLETRFCPKCDTRPCRPIIDPGYSFSSNGILPRKLLTCENCSTTFEPHTGIAINLGGMRKDDEAMEQMFLGDYRELGIAKKQKIP